MKSKQKAAVGIPLGAILCGAALVLALRHLIPIGGFTLLFFSGYIIYLWGCAGWAGAKGYTAAQGIFLGIAFPPALLLFMFRDRTKMSKAERDEDDREDAEEEKARNAARRRPLKGTNKAFAWLFGLFFFGLGLAMVIGYEVYWVRVVAPERKSLATAMAVEPDKFDPQNDGKLIHVTGALAGSETLTDPEFGVAVDALKLRRRVWMYQWQESARKSKSSYGSEDSHGNDTTYLKTQTYDYVKVWSETFINSRSFHAKVYVHVPGTPIDVKAVGADHDNPATMEISGRTVAASHITLGAFTVSSKLAEQIDNFQSVPASDKNLSAIAEPLRARAKLVGDEIYFGTNADQPAIGDLKVKFEFAPSATASVIAGQNGNSLSPYATANGGSLALLRMGTYSVPEMGAQFAKSNYNERIIVSVAGGVFILLGSFIIKQARKR